MSYYPNYFSVDDIFACQQKVECSIMRNLPKMGFLDAGCETDYLEVGRKVNLPLWYLKQLKTNNPYFTINMPSVYKNVHKAVCEADTTNIELCKLQPYFYEYGRHLTPYDRTGAIGKIVFETFRHRVRHLIDVSKNQPKGEKLERRLDQLEEKLYEVGVRTSNLYTNWLQISEKNIAMSQLVQEHSKKRKRITLDDDEVEYSQPKRQSV